MDNNYCNILLLLLWEANYIILPADPSFSGPILEWFSFHVFLSLLYVYQPSPKY